MKRDKTKTLNCKECGNEVHNVGHDAVAVTCFRCVNKSMVLGHGLDLSHEDEKQLNEEIED
ncbi:MAG: hypothetical protein ACFFKA_00090 [Candidatus Thorarchaeota archaeon]